MEQETLFTASKWDILKMLSTGPKSPIQLAKLSNTSVANVSQQLRLLEMAGLVNSKRVSNRDKGQPRLLYSLVGNHSFLISSSTDFVEKKFLQLSEYNKVILKIWFIDDPAVHYFLEKAFWHIEESLGKISAVVFDKRTVKSDDLSIIIVSEEPSVKSALKKLSVKNPGGVSRSILFSVKSESDFLRYAKSAKDSLYSLYDPAGLALPASEEINAKKEERRLK